MELLNVQRLDHLGLIAGLIKDLKLIELIDDRIETDPQEHISTGEAIAGMILNGFGFSQRLLTNSLKTSPWSCSSDQR